MPTTNLGLVTLAALQGYRSGGLEKALQDIDAAVNAVAASTDDLAGGDALYDAFVAGLPTVDPETAGALWNDSDVIMVSEPYAVLLSGLPTVDPAVAGQAWNSSGTLMISAG